MWVHDKEPAEDQDPVRKRGVKNLSTETHYYSVEMRDGGYDPKPERVLGRLEGRAARIIGGLHYGSGLDPKEQAALAVFVALMKFRVSSYRKWSRGYVAENEARIKERAFPSVEAMREDLRRLGLPEAEDRERIERAFRDVHSGDLKMILSKNHMLEHMFSHSQKIAETLLQFDWTFAWAQDGTSFATSDDPVLVLDEDLQTPEDFFGKVGFASPGTTKVLPLRQDVCLVIGSGEHEIAHGRLGREMVRRLNLKQINHYERWLIARDEALVKRLVDSNSSRRPT